MSWPLGHGRVREGGRRTLPLARLFLGLVALAMAAAGANCQARTYVNCEGLCQTVLPCNSSYDQCLAFCSAQEEKCKRVGHPSVFLSYLACTTDAGFSCNEAGMPVANAPCTTQQEELVQCESATDATLDFPDGSFDASALCVDAGNCLSCCKELFPKGAKEYESAVKSCACGSVGGCGNVCADSGCASPAKMPTAGDKCDQCLSNALNEQQPQPGPCVEPVTLKCNTQANVECAQYTNCVSQSGCTN